MAENLKIISFVNFRSGGKSSVARLIAEKLNTTILNFDKKRDSENYNAISTINISENKSIIRQENSLLLADKTSEQELKTKSGYLICDFGGYYDERIVDLKSDIYIIPSFDDFESISESMRTANYILKHIPTAKFIFILNGALIFDKDTREEKKKEFKEHLQVNGLERFKTLYLPNTKLMRKLVDEASKRSELKGKYEQEIRYPKIDKFIDKLFEEIK